MSPRHRRTCAIAALVVLLPLARAAAQTAAPTPAGTPAATYTPPLLLIYREEVKPGHAAAHAANEEGWSTAFSKANAPAQWLGMTTLAGPTEAWFISAYESYEAWQKVEDAMDAVPALRATDDKFSAQEREHLSRTSSILTSFRPALSYQPDVNLPLMRYMQIDVVRVKPGHDSTFRAAWRAQVEAHTAAKMDEHWAVYEVDAGAQDLTFFFFYPKTSMSGFDAAGPMHTADAYRNAVGEAGRTRMREMYQAAIESSTTYVFKLRPTMSTLTKAWIDADPTFWGARATQPVATVATAAAKKK